MNNNKLRIDEYDNGIALEEVIRVIKSKKLQVIAITAMFAVGSVFFALSIPNQYRATAILAPANSAGSGLSYALSQLGGLASLAGVNIGNAESSESQIAQEVMKSWSFVEKFIVDNDLAVPVYAAESWIKESNKLKIDQDVYDIKSGKWLLKDEAGNLGPPTSWQLFEKFSKISTQKMF